MELPHPDPLEISDFQPSQYALKVLRDERKQQKEWCEEARRTTTSVGMKPVDQLTR